MSYYTEQIATKIIDANVYVQNLRAEFQLPANNYGNRWRLQDVGLTTAGGTPVYNLTAGALASIKSIRLLNGRDELDACRECNRYLAFKQFNKKNEVGISKAEHYAQSKSGMEIAEGNLGTPPIARPFISNSFPADTLTDNEATTPKAYLDLRECLPMLKSVEVFPASMFPQLRVVIEYETDAIAMVSDTGNAVSTTRPTLSIDVIEDEGLVNGMMSELDGASWDCVEHDQFLVPASNAGENTANSQKVSARLNGFNNKRLMRVAFAKVASDSRNYVSAGGAVLPSGSLCSDALIQEKLQVRVNNKPKLARNGANGRNQRLGMLVDSHGDCNVVYGSNMVSANKFSERVQTSMARSGGRDYYGMKVNEVVKDLQVELERYVQASTKNNNELCPEQKAYHVHAFGEVRKQMVVKGNSYQIIYA